MGIRFINTEEPTSTTETYIDLIERLRIVALNKDSNAEVLKNAVSKDLVEGITLIALIEQEPGSSRGHIFSKSIAQELGVSEDVVISDAILNSSDPSKKTALDITSLASFLGAVVGGAPFGGEPFGSDISIVTNKERMLGAAVIAYPDTLELVARSLGGDITILPSSIHEVLVLKTVDDDYEALLDMVTSINKSEVHPSERLADNVYHYDTGFKKLETFKDYLSRKGLETINEAHSTDELH